MERDDLIISYHRMGLKFKEILNVLAQKNGIVISRRHLFRDAKRLGLTKRNYSDLGEVAIFINDQLLGAGKLHGYRWMYHKCQYYGLNVRMEDVRLIIGALDPEGVALRRQRRLTRRVYSTPGPNFLWHLDSYDKLKKFGICINGCIDGCSRKIIWLKAYHTSSDPRVIAGYYIQAVSQLGACPMLLRGDPGTENSVVKRMQPYLRRDRNTGQNLDRSYLEGSSTANQRIESFWRQLKMQCIQHWLTLLHRIQDDGFFTGSFLDKNCIQFCLMGIIQDQLDSCVSVWNQHRIRKCSNGDLPHGFPNVMYNLPMLYGLRQCKQLVPRDDVDTCRQETTDRTVPCNADIFDLFFIIMREENIDWPKTDVEAVDLYLNLRESVTDLLA